MTTLKDKTPGIVLSSIPINDHWQFVHIYTERLGRITCRVPLASRGRRASQMRQTFTPMTMLDLVLSGFRGALPNTTTASEILQIQELSIVRSPYYMTLSHPEKATQCLFMAELIDHTVREVEANAQLWQFITGSLEILESLDRDWANFHLVFICGLARQLGFYIAPEGYMPGQQLDLLEVAFTSEPIPHPYYLNAESAHWFHHLLLLDYSTLGNIKLNRLQRAALLDMALAFLNLHIPEMGKLHSVEVLRTLFE